MYARNWLSPAYNLCVLNWGKRHWSKTKGMTMNELASSFLYICTVCLGLLASSQREKEKKSFIQGLGQGEDASPSPHLTGEEGIIDNVKRKYL
jgi:hypothetical protein